jgi:hypothetical protein
MVLVPLQAEALPAAEAAPAVEEVQPPVAGARSLVRVRRSDRSRARQELRRRRATR